MTRQSNLPVATRIYRILVANAVKGKTITYERLAELVELPTQGHAMIAPLSRALGDVLNFCDSRNLPPITSLVVRKSGTDEGLPGPGYWAGRGFQPKSHAEKVTLTKEHHSLVYRFYEPLA